MKAKLVYPGGWVRTTLLSQRFIPVDERCELCGRASCGPYWFHLARRVICCLKCLDPWQTFT